MNKLFRHALLCSFIATTAYANELSTQEPNNIIPLHNEALEHIETLNGGPLWDLEIGLAKFLREHAQEIAGELEYLVDHADADANAAYYAAIMQFIDGVESTLKINPLAHEQTRAQFIKSDSYRALMAHITTLLSATKTYATQMLVADTCPLLHKALTFMEDAEKIVTDFNAAQQNQADDYTEQCPVLDEITHQMMMESFVVYKAMVQAAYDYMHTKQHADLFKKLIRAWAALMQEKEFFETLKTKSLPATMPETLPTFMRSLDDYGQAFQTAVLPMFPEDAFDDFSFEEFDAGYDADIEDSYIDFSTHFKKKHQK